MQNSSATTIPLIVMPDLTTGITQFSAQSGGLIQSDGESGIVTREVAVLILSPISCFSLTLSA